MTARSTYADVLTEQLAEMGYTHCFLLPGGANMHLVNAARTHMTCIPVVHEASAVIAAEYFNEISTNGRAYALVTVGPGVTNALTGVAGAWLESRHVLILAGQVKSADLAHGQVRQRGIQELDGVAIMASVTAAAVRLAAPQSAERTRSVLSEGALQRKGPVYIEVCLDAQGQPWSPETIPQSRLVARVRERSPLSATSSRDIQRALDGATRPVLLIGGGVDYHVAQECSPRLAHIGVPLMTTWNGFDRVADDHPCFAGRPNTWGQRSANIILSQADCIIALGTRLGLQQTGFTWQQWGPAEGKGVVIQVELDSAELSKGHPRVDLPIHGDANEALLQISRFHAGDWQEWTAFIREVRAVIAHIDPANTSREGYLCPYELVKQLSSILGPSDVFIPASSGSGNFIPMQAFQLKLGQRLVSNKGLASMGYGLPGAIGAAIGGRRRTFLLEGDGSLAQSVQDLGTVAVNQLPLKLFVLSNEGYASIRATQRNYFNGAYMGCDAATGLGLPDWQALAGAYSIPSAAIGASGLNEPRITELLESAGPALFVVPVDPTQTYWPKVTSRLADNGSMESSPIHLMSPPLDEHLARQVFRYKERA